MKGGNQSLVAVEVVIVRDLGWVASAPDTIIEVYTGICERKSKCDPRVVFVSL